MKVYTHFEYLDSYRQVKGKDIQDGIRWRTLLQYGSSWDIIGSVVMMNPGSSFPKNETPVQGDVLNHLKTFENGLIGHPWYEYSEDNAMINVGKLFALKNGFSDRGQLNGVIQIFNLFYLKEKDLGQAKALAKALNLPNFLSYDIDCLLHHNNKELNAPVYLGFGGLAFDKDFRDNAEQFFNCVIDKPYGQYLNQDYDKNKFYYPTYIVGRGKSQIRAQKDLINFIRNSYNASYDTSNTTNRILKIKTLLKRKDTLQWIYEWDGLMSFVNEFFTEVRNCSYKGSKNYKENIAIDLYEDNGVFNIVVFHRNLTESKTRELIENLWNGKVQHMPCDAPYKHLYRSFPADTPDEVIVDEMNKLLDEICNYRNEHYPL